MKLTKNNLDLMKKVFEIKPCVVLRAKYSQASTKEFFKFYDENINVGDHKVLDVEDYGRFISTRSSRREPAITRVISKYHALRHRSASSRKLNVTRTFDYPVMHPELSSETIAFLLQLLL